MVLWSSKFFSNHRYAFFRFFQHIRPQEATRPFNLWEDYYQRSGHPWIQSHKKYYLPETSARLLSRFKIPLNEQRGHPQKQTTRARDHRAATFKGKIKRSHPTPQDVNPWISWLQVGAFDHHMCRCTREPSDGRICSRWPCSIYVACGRVYSLFYEVQGSTGAQQMKIRMDFQEPSERRTHKYIWNGISGTFRILKISSRE